MSSVGVHARRTYCSTAVLTRHVEFSSYLDGTTTSSKEKGGDMKWHGQRPHRSDHSGIIRRESSALVHAYSRGCLGMSAAMLKTGPKAEETALPAWFCLEIMLHENVMIPWFGSYWSWKVLPSVICVAKLLDIVGNLCHVLGETTLKKWISSWQNEQKQKQ